MRKTPNPTGPDGALLVYTKALPDRKERIRVWKSHATTTIEVDYDGQIRTHGKTKDEAVSAMAELLKDEIEPQSLRRVAASAKGTIGKLHVVDKAGKLRSFFTGCIYNLSFSPPRESMWMVFVPMRGLSATGQTLGDAISKLRDFVSKARLDNDFLIALFLGLHELSRAYVAPHSLIDRRAERARERVRKKLKGTWEEKEVSQTLSVIRQAIIEKTPITARYRDDTSPRVLCPHVVGRKGTSPETMWRTLCYQASGAGESGMGPDPAQNWRCLILSELRSVSLAPDLPWETVDNHSRPQWCVDQDKIIAEVSY